MKKLRWKKGQVLLLMGLSFCVLQLCLNLSKIVIYILTAATTEMVSAVCDVLLMIFVPVVPLNLFYCNHRKIIDSNDRKLPMISAIVSGVGLCMILVFSIFSVISAFPRFEIYKELGIISLRLICIYLRDNFGCLGVLGAAFLFAGSIRAVPKIHKKISAETQCFGEE